ncbi:MAG: hypothetical protein NW207_11075 [Cytophagales bacterium]|nr:hypothetical protein [Cytophagales bacterium]
MKKTFTKLAIIVTMFFLAGQAFAQKFLGVGIDKPNPRAVIHLNVEDPTNYPQGFMPPRLTTAQRNNTGFTTVLTANSTLTGMTVYDTDLNAFFVWTGAAWVQLATASGPVNLTALGIGGALVSTSGLSFTVDGTNMVKVNQLVTVRDVSGDYTNGFTVVGLNGYNITGNPSASTPILSFDGTAFQYVAAPANHYTTIVGVNNITILGDDLTGFTVSGPNLATQPTTVLGIGVTVLGSGTLDQTIIGQNLVAGTNVTITGNTINANPLASIVGVNNITIMGDGMTGFTVSGPNLATQPTTVLGLGVTVLGSGTLDQTIIGQNLVAGTNVTITGNTIDVAAPTPVTSIVGLNNITIMGDGMTGFTVSGPTFSPNSVIGVAGLQSNTIGNGTSISGVGLVVLQQSFTNVIGSASTVALGTGSPLIKAPVKIPVGVNKIRVTLNAYISDGLGTGSFRVQIGTAFLDEFAVTNTSVDNMLTFATDIDVSSLTLTSPQLVRVYTQVNGGEPAAYIGGITLTVSE